MSSSTAANAAAAREALIRAVAIKSAESINPATVPALVHAIAGALGGVSSLTVTYPLFSLVTRMAVKSKNADGQQQSAMAALQEVLQKEGVLGLFAGLESAVLASFVSQFVYYYWYEWLRSVMSAQGTKQLGVSHNLLIAALAGAATAVATNPIWLINSRMSTQAKAGQTSLGMMAEIVEKEGVSALFAGVLPGLVLVTNPTIQYAAYEQLKSATEVVVAGKTTPLTALQVFYLGAVAKAIATVATFPLQIVKTRMQVNQGTLSATLKTIFDNDGFRGFYHGIETKIVQSVLTAAFLFLFKDQLFIFTVKLLQTIRPSLLVH